MEISNLSQYWAQILIQKQTTEKETVQREQQLTDSQTESAVDQYIPLQAVDADMPMPSEMYNELGSMASERPPMPPMPTTVEETDETEETDESIATAMAAAYATASETAQDSSSIDDTFDSILSQISETMRVNKDNIISTMEELGLTASDLLSEEGMSTLTDALNSKAEAMGLPTIADLDTATSSLSDFAASAVESLKSNLSIEDDELAILIQAFLDKIADLADETTDDTASSTITEEV